jgi:cardiolipin synthase
MLTAGSSAANRKGRRRKSRPPTAPGAHANESPLRKIRQKADTPATVPPQKAGFSTGVNLAAGCDDDGWTIPPPVKLADGTTLQLYKDGEALRAAYEAIESARRRVCVEMYIFADDPTGHAFADLLARKAREGVRVFVIYDSFASRGLAGPMTEPLRRMRAAGVRLAQFHPMRPWECLHSWHPFNRDHRKLFVVDDHTAGMGGLNIGNEYAGSWVVSDVTGEFWRDNGVTITGPGVEMFFRCFRQTWHYLHHGGRMRRLAHAEHLDDGADLGVLASAPTIESRFRPLIGKLLTSAAKSITMTMAYFAPDDGLAQTLCDAARRGVRVRVMFPGVSDVPLVRLAGRAFYDNLINAGVEVYERQHVVLHAKTLCVDGCRTVIGSANLDYRSIEYNCELSAVVRSADFGRQIEDLFDNDVRYARRITKDEWRRLHWWDKFVQWAVSRARYAL